jgi:hypothetical protein
MQDDKHKIFILSSERSGTNLLQKLLSNHSEIVGPKTPQLLNTLHNHERFYGDLNILENKNYLINDLQQICNHEFSKWDLEIESNPLDLVTDKKFVEAIIKLYVLKTNQENKKGFVAKELNAHLFLNEIIHIDPNTKFIHLVRNPLEQAASWMKTPLFYSNPEAVVKDWYNTQNIILNKKNQYPNHIITCRYEDLVNNTRVEMTRILDFCDLPVDENCFQNKKKRENDNWNELWKNVNKEVGNNLNKHEEELHKYEIDVVKHIAYPITNELGYFDDIPKFSFNKKYKLKKVLRDLKSRKKRKKVRGSEITTDRIKFAKIIKQNIIKKYLNA